MGSQVLNELLSSFNSNTNVTRKIQSAKAHCERRKKDYDILVRAGTYLFKSRENNPSCGDRCLNEACVNFELFTTVIKNSYGEYF